MFRNYVYYKPTSLKGFMYDLKDGIYIQLAIASIAIPLKIMFHVGSSYHNDILITSVFITIVSLICLIMKKLYNKEALSVTLIIISVLFIFLSVLLVKVVLLFIYIHTGLFTAIGDIVSFLGLIWFNYALDHQHNFSPNYDANVNPVINHGMNNFGPPPPGRDSNWIRENRGMYPRPQNVPSVPDHILDSNFLSASRNAFNGQVESIRALYSSLNILQLTVTNEVGFYKIIPRTSWPEYINTGIVDFRYVSVFQHPWYYPTHSMTILVNSLQVAIPEDIDQLRKGIIGCLLYMHNTNCIALQSGMTPWTLVQLQRCLYSYEDMCNRLNYKMEQAANYRIHIPEFHIQNQESIVADPSSIFTVSDNKSHIWRMAKDLIGRSGASTWGEQNEKDFVRAAQDFHNRNRNQD